mmetsp:Transcript_33598/g.51717  ORF Transcript_33598/g.51717 Transcript_33598/m.51717 type:complete len:151 (+) Transcript_33598:9882-10334(+)
MMLSKKDHSPMRLFQNIVDTSPAASSKNISDFSERLQQQHPSRSNIEKGSTNSPLKLDKNNQFETESRTIFNIFEVLSDCDPDKRPDNFKSARHLRSISQGIKNDLESKIKSIETFIRDIKRDICLDQKMEKKFQQTMERLMHKEQQFKR